MELPEFVDLIRRERFVRVSTSLLPENVVVRMKRQGFLVRCSKRKDGTETCQLGDRLKWMIFEPERSILRYLRFRKGEKVTVDELREAFWPIAHEFDDVIADMVDAGIIEVLGDGTVKVLRWDSRRRHLLDRAIYGPR